MSDKITTVADGVFSVDELVEDVEYIDSKNKYSNLKFKVNDGVLLQADISDLRSHYRVCGISYNDIMDTRFVECEFEPRRNERYYYPSFSNALGYEVNEWFGSDNSNRIRRNVGVYRTSNQAREKARELGWLDD